VCASNLITRSDHINNKGHERIYSFLNRVTCINEVTHVYHRNNRHRLSVSPICLHPYQISRPCPCLGWNYFLYSAMRITLFAKLHIYSRIEKN